jgi:competence protein ComEA
LKRIQEVDVLGNGSRQNAEEHSVSLPALVAVAVVSLIVAALFTTTILIAADRFDRPSLVVADASLPTIVVQIDGAVATPGTYRLPGGARLDDLVGLAGGLTSDADVTSVNLAARVGDGEGVRIPARSTSTPTQPTTGTATAAARINVNTASVADLERLPGIGPVLSERIVAYREANGPFNSLDQIAEVDGISTGLLEQLRPMITLDD